MAIAPVPHVTRQTFGRKLESGYFGAMCSQVRARVNCHSRKGFVGKAEEGEKKQSQIYIIIIIQKANGQVVKKGCRFAPYHQESHPAYIDAAVKTLGVGTWPRSRQALREFCLGGASFSPPSQHHSVIFLSPHSYRRACYYYSEGTLTSLWIVDGRMWTRAHAIPSTGGRCLLYTSPSPRDGLLSRMPSSA